MNDTKNPVTRRIELPSGWYIEYPGNGKTDNAEFWLYNQNDIGQMIVGFDEESARHFASAMNAQPAAQPQGAVDDDKVLEQRDYAQEQADELASFIAEITGEDIGEHSSANDPWSRAMLAAQDYITERKNAASQTAAANAVIADLVEAVESLKTRMVFKRTTEAKHYVQDDQFWIHMGEKALTRARAYQSGQPAAAASGWLPIDTAPKDGTFLVYCPNDNWPMYVAQRSQYGFIQANSGWECNPTHWMPIPAAPQTASNDNQAGEAA